MLSELLCYAPQIPFIGCALPVCIDDDKVNRVILGKLEYSLGSVPFQHVPLRIQALPMELLHPALQKRFGFSHSELPVQWVNQISRIGPPDDIDCVQQDQAGIEGARHRYGMRKRDF